MPRTLKAIRPNKGLEAKYRKRLQVLIAEMAGSFDYRITAEYRKAPPRVAALVEQATDASPSDRMAKLMNDLADRWVARFDEAAPKIASAYLQSQFKASDLAFSKALKDAGWAVEFRMTPTMRDAFDASLAENVSLIRSIPEQYAKQVEGIVMRSYTAGRNLSTMVEDLKKLYPEAARRAEFIARDQSNKANAVVNRVRQLELGITEAIWMHSRAGKHPRPDHVAADGKKYMIAEGCYISGKYIQPGEEPNCRCTSRPVLPV